MWRFLVILGVVAGTPALGSVVTDATVCDAAAHSAAQASGVPIGILLSISRVETGRKVAGEYAPWPWAANVSGKGYFFEDAASAMEFAQGQLDAGNANFDVGCFQINLRWHARHFQSLEDAFDPEHNAAYAAQFLTELRQSEGSWAGAVAAYHSRTPDLAEGYLQKVKAVWSKISGDTEPVQAAPMHATPLQVARENRYPLLRGGVGRTGSLVPMVDGAPLIGQN